MLIFSEFSDSLCFAFELQNGVTMSRKLIFTRLCFTKLLQYIYTSFTPVLDTKFDKWSNEQAFNILEFTLNSFSLQLF